MQSQEHAVFEAAASLSGESGTKPKSVGVHVGQHLSFADCTVESQRKAKVRTGFGKSDGPGSKSESIYLVDNMRKASQGQGAER
jgi:hypothetical protein